MQYDYKKEINILSSSQTFISDCLSQQELQFKFCSLQMSWFWRRLILDTFLTELWLNLFGGWGRGCLKIIDKIILKKEKQFQHFPS